jgi:hypothetical protein
MVYQGIPLVNLTGCEIRSVLFGLNRRVEEWNLIIRISHPVWSRTRAKSKGHASDLARRAGASGCVVGLEVAGSRAESHALG